MKTRFAPSIDAKRSRNVPGSPVRFSESDPMNHDSSPGMRTSLEKTFSSVSFVEAPRFTSSVPMIFSPPVVRTAKIPFGLKDCLIW